MEPSSSFGEGVLSTLAPPLLLAFFEALKAIIAKAAAMEEATVYVRSERAVLCTSVKVFREMLKQAKNTLHILGGDLRSNTKE